MNWRIAYYALCALVLAGIVHISIILLIPTYGRRDAYAVISRKMEPFAFREIAGTGSDALLSDVDPFFSYGVCRFELGEAGLLMKGPKIDSFWSATVLDEDGTVVYSLNSRTALDRKLDLVVLSPVQLLRLREAQPVSVDVGGRGQDDRIEHQDVGHRDERDQPAAQFGTDRRSAGGYLEEPVQPGADPVAQVRTFIGGTFQIWSQYSRMDRSEENLPLRAALRIDILDQVSRSFHAWSTRSWHSM